MHKAAFILIDPHSGTHQIPVIGAGRHVNKPFVPAVGRNDPHVHAPLCRQAQGRHHAVIYDEVRGVDIHIVLSLVENLEIDMLPHIFSIQRTVGVGLHKSIRLHRTGLIFPRVVCQKILLPAGADLPHLQKHDG